MSCLVVANHVPSLTFITIDGGGDQTSMIGESAWSGFPVSLHLAKCWLQAGCDLPACTKKPRHCKPSNALLMDDDQREGDCCVTGEDFIQRAHLIPKTEWAWWIENGMSDHAGTSGITRATTTIGQEMLVPGNGMYSMYEHKRGDKCNR